MGNRTFARPIRLCRTFCRNTCDAAQALEAHMIHNGSSRNGGVARDKREERDSRDV